MSIKSLVDFLIGLLVFTVVLQVFLMYLGNQSLVCFILCKYFLPFCRCLFILFIVTVSVWKRFSRYSPSCLFLLLLSVLLVSSPKYHCWDLELYPRFSSRSLLVSDLKIWVLNPLWIGFCVWCKLSVWFQHVDVQFSSAICRRHCPVLCLCWTSVDHICMDLFVGYFVPLVYVSFKTYHMVLITVALRCSLKSVSVMPQTWFFFLKIALAIFVVPFEF